MFVLGERGRQVRFGLQPLVVLADLMQRDGSWGGVFHRTKSHQRSEERGGNRFSDSRDCASAIDWQSVVVISRMIPSTAAT